MSNLKPHRDLSIQRALIPGCAENAPHAFNKTPGGMTVGVSGGFLSVAFNNTPGNHNVLVVLAREDAAELAFLLTQALLNNNSL